MRDTRTTASHPTAPADNEGRGSYAAALAGLLLLVAGSAGLIFGLGGMPASWVVAALLIGVLLLAVEIFVFPGLSPIAVLSALFLVVGFLGAALPDGRAHPWLGAAQLGPVRPVDAVAVGGGLSGLWGLRLMWRHVPHLPFMEQMRLRNPQREHLVPAPQRPRCEVGDVGVVTTPLRPSGRARFGDEVVDVRTQGEYVDIATRVQIVKREGAAFVVCPSSAPQRAATSYNRNEGLR